MTRTTHLLTAGFLGLASLFTAGNAQAEHDRYDRRNDDVRVGVRIGTGNGSIVFSNGGVDFRRSEPRVVIDRVWVPDRYEERHTQVLVQKGYWTEKHTQVLVRAGYYEDRHTQVLVERGHWQTRYIQPVYRQVHDRYGRCTTVMVAPGRHERFWVPDRYETRCEKVWIAPIYETRCEKVWVPDRYETRCEKVLVPGYWQETRRVIDDRCDDRGRVNVTISHRGR